MDNTENSKKKDFYLKIIITETICSLLIISICLIFKYFFKEQFEDFKKLYLKHATTNTSVEEVTDS